MDSRAPMSAPFLPPSPPPAGGDVDAGPKLIAVTWILSSVSAVLVALRFYTRTRITHNLWWDDWWILITLIHAFVFSGIFTAYALLGGGRHIYYLLQAIDARRLSLIIELNWIGQVFSISAIVLGKISVALLIYRIQAPNVWRTRFLLFSCVSCVVLWIVLLTLFFAQCTPARALWDPPAGRCWSPNIVRDFGLFAGSWSAVVDASLALLPVTIVAKLNLSLKKRALLCFLLGLGVFAAISGAIKTSYITALDATADLTWITVSLLEWNATEANVIIIAACLPTVRPLFVKAIQRVRSLGSMASPQPSGYRRQPSPDRQTLELDDVSSTSHLKAQSRLEATGRGDDASAEERRQDCHDDELEAGGIRQTIRMEVTSDERSLRRCK